MQDMLFPPRLLLIVVAMLCWTAHASAHSQSYGYLSLKEQSGTLELAIRDLGQLISLDSDADGKVTWGEVRRNETAIAATALAGISLSRVNAPCTLAGGETLVDSHGGETYLVMPFAMTCPNATGPLTIAYHTLFDIDAQHRGLVTVVTGNGTQTFVMSPDAQSVTVSETGAFGRFVSFVKHGMHHLLTGYDHMLFLITLLLAAAMQNRTTGVRAAIVEATKVVTAFTLSHSVTLGLAATGFVSIPVPLTESLIAITIALAAINNLWPVVRGRIWLLALCFGLIHGLGFANVLADLGLPTAGLLQALLAFNLGVEFGQLAVVLVALPFLVFLTRSERSAKAIPLANIAIALIGTAWFADRALGTAIMPF
jgi:HupE / UreJ protein